MDEPDTTTDLRTSLPENNLGALQATMTATIQVKRAATGKVDEYKLTFTPLGDEQQPREN